MSSFFIQVRVCLPKAFYIPPHGLMLSMKKSQAAMEYLMTYGWAILVVLIVFGALIFMGALRFMALVPEKCIAPSGFICESVSYGEDGSLTVALTPQVSGAGGQISFEPVNPRGVEFEEPPEQDFGEGARIFFTTQVTGEGAPQSGNKLRAKFHITYTDDHGFAKSAPSGEIVVTRN